MLMSGRKGLGTRLWLFRLLRQIEDIRGQRATVYILSLSGPSARNKNTITVVYPVSL